MAKLKQLDTEKGELESQLTAKKGPYMPCTCTHHLVNFNYLTAADRECAVHQEKDRIAAEVKRLKV